MAIITATFDTVSKELVVKNDGKVIDNVSYVSFCNSFSSDGDMTCRIETMVENEDDDMKEMGTLMAKEYKAPDVSKVIHQYIEKQLITK